MIALFTFVEHLEGDIAQIAENIDNLSFQILKTRRHVLVNGKASNLFMTVLFAQQVGFHGHRHGRVLVTFRCLPKSGLAQSGIGFLPSIAASQIS